MCLCKQSLHLDVYAPYVACELYSAVQKMPTNQPRSHNWPTVWGGVYLYVMAKLPGYQMIDTVHEFLQNIHVTAYSPLGTPPSSAMFKDYQPDLVMNDHIVKEMAKKYNKNVGQVRS